MPDDLEISAALQLHRDVRNRVAATIYIDADVLETAAQEVERALATLAFESHPLEFGQVATTLGDIRQRQAQAGLSTAAPASADAYRLALLAVDPASFRAEFIRLQSALGRALRRAAEACQADVGRAADQAAAAFEAALEALPTNGASTERAELLTDSGAVLRLRASLLPSHDREEIRSLIERAARPLLEAAEIWTREGDDERLAHTFLELGAAFAIFPDDDRAAIVERAVDFYRRAGEHFPEVSHPTEFARVQAGLGSMLVAHPGDDRPRLLPAAIGMLRTALRHLDETSVPLDAARVHRGLGDAIMELAAAGGDVSIDEAVSHYQHAARIYAAARLRDAEGDACDRLKQAQAARESSA